MTIDFPAGLVLFTQTLLQSVTSGLQTNQEQELV